jgi:hypothetical protein
MSDPRMIIDTAGLSPKATLLANRLAGSIDCLAEEDMDALLKILDQSQRLK